MHLESRYMKTEIGLDPLPRNITNNHVFSDSLKNVKLRVFYDFSSNLIGFVLFRANSNLFQLRKSSGKKLHS